MAHQKLNYSCPLVFKGDWFQDPLQISRPLYKMALNNAYSEPSTSTDSQMQIRNTVFDPWLAESVDVTPRDMKGRLYIY